MKNPKVSPLAAGTILTLAEVKAAIEAFDRGEANAFDALDVIIMAVDAYKAAADRRREAA